MTNSLIKLLCLLGVMLASASAWSATYVYAGPPYTTVGGIYTTSMRITGSFTTVNPLAPNLSNVEIGPSGQNLVTSWSFSDGVTTFANINSSIYANEDLPTPSFNGLDFTVSTNATGNIVSFSIGLEKPPLWGWGVDPMWVDAFRVVSTPALYQATSRSPCRIGIVVMEFHCSGFDDPGPNFGSAQTAGSFSTVEAIPALSGGGVLLLLGLMAISAGFYLRRNSD